MTLTDAERDGFTDRLNAAREKLTAKLGREPTLVAVADEMGVSRASVRNRYVDLGLDTRAGMHALATTDRTPGTIDGAKVKQFARDQGIRLVELAELAGFGSRHTLWRLISSPQVPRDVDLRGLSTALGVSDRDILVPTPDQERVAFLEKKLAAKRKRGSR